MIKTNFRVECEKRRYFTASLSTVDVSDIREHFRTTEKKVTKSSSNERVFLEQGSYNRVL